MSAASSITIHPLRHDPLAIQGLPAGAGGCAGKGPPPPLPSDADDRLTKTFTPDRSTSHRSSKVSFNSEEVILTSRYSLSLPESPFTSELPSEGGPLAWTLSRAEGAAVRSIVKLAGPSLAHRPLPAGSPPLPESFSVLGVRKSATGEDEDELSIQRMIDLVERMRRARERQATAFNGGFEWPPRGAEGEAEEVDDNDDAGSSTTAEMASVELDGC